MPAKNKTKPKPATQSFEEPKEVNKKDLIRNIITKKPKEKFLNDNQKKYYQLLKEKEIIICSGSAGTGKSHLALRAAVDLILDPKTPYEKLIITRPAVEGSDSRLGFLPGTILEKMDPYIQPTYHLIDDMIGKENRFLLKNYSVMEIIPISFLRGYTFNNTIVLVDEAQNATPLEMKLILTRIGKNSKLFIIGDTDQSDKFKNKQESGLYDILNRLNDIDEIGIFEFGLDDVVRNPIISIILKKY